jgi:putative inorganic carbon (hco3(-)) transporter
MKFSIQQTNTKQTLAYIAVFAFMLINSLLVVYEHYYLALLPVALIILYIVIFRLKTALLLITFFTPLSISLNAVGFEPEYDLYLPTEPMLIILTAIFLFSIFFLKQVDKRIFIHPVSIMIYVYLGWLFITAITSTMPLVSFKFLLSKIWFIVPFYFLAIPLFSKRLFIKHFHIAYLVSFVIVIIYTLYELSFYGFFDKQQAHKVMNPFFNDHTSYGAMIAMFFPSILVFTFYQYKKQKLFALLSMLLLVAFFVIALIFSYTRAAWISMVVALAVYIAIKIRIKLLPLLLLFFSLVITFFVFQQDIMHTLKKNKQDSSANLAEHAKSIANVSTDASNLERLNRWNCAFEMFKEKPIFGWGPGTYMFQYGAFQLSYDRTIISTNAADRGNAHSEYIGPLAESGFLGLVTVLALFLTIFYYGLITYKRLKSKKQKLWVVAALCGLITYFTHGFLNNFLDTDKASIPFWAFTAIIVAADIYRKREEKLT